MEPEPTNLPAQIADALVSIPKGLTPGVIKALDRLIGAGVDIPVAWLQQQKAKIDAKTASYKLIEEAIAQSAAAEISGDKETAERALNVLVRKEYRKQINRDGVAKAMIEDLRSNGQKNFENAGAGKETSVKEIDDDWMNVFEQYAENASSDRLQDLWGRVLSGEIRRPGKYSLRTLRFLSEFSQYDAVAFENLVQNAFDDAIPFKLAEKLHSENIKDLVYLESNGLLQGSTGTGLQKRIRFNEKGYTTILEGKLGLIFFAKSGYQLNFRALVLTPLAQELLSLVGNRDARAAAKAFAFAIRNPEITGAQLGVIVPSSPEDRITPIEILWQEEQGKEAVDGTAASTSEFK